MTIESDLYERLEQRYAPPEWALFQQVRNAAGFDAVRTADAIAMNLWPSRGLALHGFEIKTSRGDWLRELKDPSKAEAIAVFCDHWWIVVPDAKIVGDDLPPGWGLLAPHAKSLRVVVDAPQTEASEITRSFLGAILRRAHGVVTDRSRIQEARLHGIEQGRESARLEVERLEASRAEWERRSREADERWRDLQQRLGVPLDTWVPSTRVQAAIRFALDSNVETRIAYARRIHRDLRGLADDFEEALAGFEEEAPALVQQQGVVPVRDGGVSVRPTVTLPDDGA